MPLALMVLLVVSPASAQTPANALIAAQGPVVAGADTDPLPGDPGVRNGTLPNGMTYAILKNPRPEGAASIRLMVRVGSFEEADADRGIAHFLEHMAFNGTRSFPEGELIRRFAEAGIGFGRDQNAFTGPFSTVYSLDLNVADKDRLDLSFAWMGDVADGLIFAPAAVERERGVVMAEREARLGPAFDYQQRYSAFVAPGLRGPTRSPIGEASTLRAISSEALTAFYKAWYRPELATLIVVGDVDEADIEARIRTTFSDWTGQGPLPVSAVPGKPDLARPLDVMVSAERQQGSGISACRVRPAVLLGPDSLQRRKVYIERNLWLAILNRRLTRLAQDPEAPFTSASVSVSAWGREAAYTCLGVTPRSDATWREGLAAAQAEVARMAAHGVTQAEIDRVVAAQKESNRSAIVSAETRFSARLAAGLLAAQPFDGLDASAFTRPEDNAAIYDRVVAGITPASVHDAFLREIGGSEPLIALALPEVPDAEAVRVAWQEIEARPVPDAVAEAATTAWAYTDFGPPGRVATREIVDDPGFVRLTFENGVVVNFKSVNFSRDAILVAVRFGAGSLEVAPADYPAAGLGTVMLTPGGLGKHSMVEMADLFSSRRVAAQLSMQNRSFVLQGDTRPVDLEPQLQLLTATLTDPGFRRDFDQIRINAIRTLYRSRTSSPEAVATDALLKAIDPASPRLPPPLDVILEAGPSDFERVLKPALTQAPLEVTVVGDVDEATAVEALSRTLGAIPARSQISRARDDTWFLRYPEAPLEERVVHEGARDRAVVNLVWPLFVGDGERRDELRALGLLRLIMADAVRDEVREALGSAYSPGVSLQTSDFGDQGSLDVSIATNPAQAQIVREAVERVAATLASPGGITATALEAARRPVLDAIPASRRTNGWWLGVMDGSAREPRIVRDAIDWEAAYRDMTVEQVQAVATTWLARKPIVVQALPSPAAGVATEPATAP
ncbi:insulinase family protein [Brevundimonas variabilis]|uniref:insulinase family protein n=1 Tax=Brevundimonas variabilis TaxID=74312 RepID=UPI0016061850